MTELKAAARPSNAAPAISPIGAAFRAFEQEGMDALYARARDEEPVFYAPEIGYWVVTRHADIVSVFRDPERFSASNALTPITALPDDVVAILREGRFTVQPVQVNSDPPVHGRIRALVGQYLNAKRYLTLEAPIRALVESYADRLEGKDQADVVAEMTYELPARVIFLLLGISDADTADIKRWADKRLLLTWGQLTAEDQADAAREMLDYWDYCKRLVDARMMSPRDDYPSRLLELRGGDDSTLSLNEVYCLVFGILLAGHETTTNASTNIVNALLTHRDQWRRLVDDPSLIPNAVEEGLRYATSVVNWRRVAREEVVIGGVRVPEGANLLLALASAGRDKTLFEEPDTLQVDRQNARQHIAFGHGIHFCIGAALARLQLKIILETLTRRFPDMTLVEDQRLDWVRTISFRGPLALHVHPHGA